MLEINVDPWFRGATDGAEHCEVLRKLLRHFPGKSVSTGQILCLQDEPARCLCLILEGEVSLTTACESGNEIEVSALGPGDLAGIEAVCVPHYLATAQATGPCRVSFIPRKRFLAILNAHPDLATAVLSRIVGELCALRERLSDFCSRSAAQRLAHHLLKSASAQNESRVALPWGARAKLSRRLAMKQETLSRSLQELSRRGLVQVLRTELILLNLAGLREFGG